jgi:hypothetical protein
MTLAAACGQFHVSIALSGFSQRYVYITTSNNIKDAGVAASVQWTRVKAPNSGQEVVRQCILLIPLATAAVGSAALRLAQIYVDILPRCSS